LAGTQSAARQCGTHFKVATQISDQRYLNGVFAFINNSKISRNRPTDSGRTKIQFKIRNIFKVTLAVFALDRDFSESIIDANL
jgi:hypothetical protein